MDLSLKFASPILDGERLGLEEGVLEGDLVGIELRLLYDRR